MARHPIVIAILAGVAVAARAAAACAQNDGPVNSRSADLSGKTGKERLSDKASDEQRDDNCQVPREKSGSKARPATAGAMRASLAN